MITICLQILSKPSELSVYYFYGLSGIEEISSNTYPHKRIFFSGKREFLGSTKCETSQMCVNILDIMITFLFSNSFSTLKKDKIHSNVIHMVPATAILSH